MTMDRDRANEMFEATSFLYGGNADYIEDLYARYQENPGAVEPQWRDFFGKLADDRLR